MYLVRLLIVGETGVGKTSLLVRFNEDNFISDQKTTIGVDYKAKEVDIDDEVVKLQIWDTAGQERFRSMTSAFYSKAQGVVVTFDVTERDTFLALPSWIRDIRMSAPSYCVIILCANKVDLPLEFWSLGSDEYMNFAQENGYTIFESSASTGVNVKELFVELGREVLKKNRHELTEVDEKQSRDGESLILFDFNEKERRKRKEKGSCCLIC